MSAQSALPPAGAAGTVSNDLFRLLVHSVKDYAIFLLDPGGHVATWNEGAQRIKGYADYEIVGKHFSTFYPREAVDSGWPDYELAVAERAGRFEDEGWRVRKDGSLFWADVVITALRDETDRLVGFAKVTRDLTERRRAEEQLRQSEERYRTLVDAVRDYAIYMLDPEGYVVTWNSGAERLKGYTADEIVGKHFSTFYPPERAAEGFPAQELEIARTEGRFEEENWRVRKDGSRFWANVVLTAVLDRNGKLQGFSKVTRDITERHELELAAQNLTRELNRRVEELAATNEVLAEKNQEIESFVYSVSHDVRGPLVNLQGFNREIQRSCRELSDLIESNPSIPAPLRRNIAGILDGDIRESSGFMESAVTHLGRIVDGLLRLSRLGRVEYQCRKVDVNEMVLRIVRSMQTAIQAKRATVQIHHLPEAWADASGVEQVFSNLISNALAYSDPSRDCKIEIGGDVVEDRVVYYVKDNGLGLPPEAAQKLFTAFRRFHPFAAPGEGMGLATVKRIVDRLGGRIRVDSQPGEGATFTFEFPDTERQL